MTLKAHTLSDRQRSFAIAYCENGGNGTQAAIAAGYSPKGADVAAHRLLGNVKIAAAIRAHKAATAERAAVTVESLTLELEKDRDTARENGQINAAIQATMGVAKLNGLLVEDRKNERSPLKDVLSRIERENGSKPRLVAVK